MEPWPAETVFADATLAAPNNPPSSNLRMPQAVVGDRAYVANGRYLYRTALLTAAAWETLGLVYDFGPGVVITDLTHYQGDLAVLCGTTRDILLFGTGQGAVPARTGQTLQAGVKGRHGTGYGGALVYGDPTTKDADLLKMTGGALGTSILTRPLDAPIVRVARFGGKVAIATRTSLWTLGGRPIAAKPDDPGVAGDQSVPATWSQDPGPFFTNGIWAADDDFAFLLSYGGRLYTWLNNHVQEFNPSSQRDGWRAVGLEGRNCYGATVAGNRLVVTMTNRRGDTETWAFDGSGWWQIHLAPEEVARRACGRCTPEAPATRTSSSSATGAPPTTSTAWSGAPSRSTTSRGRRSSRRACSIAESGTS